MSKIMYAAAPVSGAMLEDIAAQLRDIFAAREPLLPIREIVEWGLVRAVGEEYSFEVWEMSEMGDDHGRSFPDEKRIVLRHDVYEGLVDHRGRDRFTAAHEVSHLVLHSERRLARHVDDGQPIKTFCDPEWQANRLASAFLMPADMMRQYSTVQSVAKAFGVSNDAATVRMRHLKMEIKSK